MSDADAARAFYDRWAGLYDRLATHAPPVPRLRRSVVDALDPAPGDVVVEFGCGTGANFPYLRDRVGPEGAVVGVDFAPGMLARARRRIAAAGWENVAVVRGDALTPPVAAADRVLATFVSGMLPDPDAAVARWSELVGPGGGIALLDLAHSTEPVGRLLAPAFALLVRLGSPPGVAGRHDASPSSVVNDRVAAVHRSLLDRCDDATHRTELLGFARLSAGSVPRAGNV